MSDFNVIANVSETMVAVLNDALKPVDRLGVGSTAPVALLHDLHTTPAAPAGASGVLAVTLVETREDATVRNRPRVRTPDLANNDRVNVSKPPMALMLRYLVTPWSASSGNGNSNEERGLEHRMLGRVAQYLYDGPVVAGAALRGKGDDPDGSGPLEPSQGLEGSSEALKVTLAPLSFEEQTRFWHAVNQKYRASLTYDVRVVNLDPIHAQSSPRVSSREIQYGLVKN